MKNSKIKNIGGTPYIWVDGEIIPSVAYMTYFEERHDYKDFANIGFNLYSVSISLATQPINAGSGAMPYESGVFDKKGEADFSAVDESINEILKHCPNALIFPRIYICPPQWWIDENPEHTISVPHDKRRESLYSDKFREDASDWLRQLIEHLKPCDNIIGYHISGGNTQEWFHLDLTAGYKPETLPFFNKFLEKNYPNLYPAKSLPPLDAIGTDGVIDNELTRAFLQFANDEVAYTVEHFCKVAKEAVEYKQIVGVFYGYIFEVDNVLWGTHSQHILLESENIDFFSSPNSYAHLRPLGDDWGDMMAVDSVKLHNKMCFIECDVRTCLSTYPGVARKSFDPDGIYNNPLWLGPPTDELSTFAIRKSLARQLTHTHGLWWFDMFGHWFSSEMMMNEMAISKKVYTEASGRNLYHTDNEVAFFVDEKIYQKVGLRHPLASIGERRFPLGKMGAPYSAFLLSDFNNIDWANTKFKAVIVHGYNKEIEETLNKYGIKPLFLTEEKPNPSIEEYREYLTECGVFIYNQTPDVFYLGNGFVGIHAASEGEKNILFPEKLKFTDTETEKVYETDKLTLSLKQYETRLFKIEKI